jgi:hypothetical protein
MRVVFAAISVIVALSIMMIGGEPIAIAVGDRAELSFPLYCLSHACRVTTYIATWERAAHDHSERLGASKMGGQAGMSLR